MRVPGGESILREARVSRLPALTALHLSPGAQESLSGQVLHE
jgi:hypothetical protein